MDEDKLLDFLEPHIPQGGYIVDFHASNFFPERYFDFVFVLRTNNSVLYDRLKLRGYTEHKIKNNVECEIFQECLLDVKESYNSKIIYEFDNTKEEDMNNVLGQIFEVFKNCGTFNRFKQAN